jgi:hypothetical protein
MQLHGILRGAFTPEHNRVPGLSGSSLLLNAVVLWNALLSPWVFCAA